jgi:hypothetical protein
MSVADQELARTRRTDGLFCGSCRDGATIAEQRDRLRGAVEERDALRAALFPFLRLDHDIGDEWHEDCERARAAYGGAEAR